MKHVSFVKLHTFHLTIQKNFLFYQILLPEIPIIFMKVI